MQGSLQGDSFENGEVIITEKYSMKNGSIFILKSAIAYMFESGEQPLLPAPPILEDNDLVFFKDDNGREYQVLMRGERTREGIYFQVKGVMDVFKQPSLAKQIVETRADRSSYIFKKHYQWFSMSTRGNAENSQSKELIIWFYFFH